MMEVSRINEGLIRQLADVPNAVRMQAMLKEISELLASLMIIGTEKQIRKDD